jgi:hypothetical protein
VNLGEELDLTVTGGTADKNRLKHELCRMIDKWQPVLRFATEELLLHPFSPWRHVAQRLAASSQVSRNGGFGSPKRALCHFERILEFKPKHISVVHSEHSCTFHSSAPCQRFWNFLKTGVFVAEETDNPRQRERDE